MTDSVITVRDKLGDPAGWPLVPADFNPPNEHYLLARLASVSCHGPNVHIVLRSDEQIFENVFVMESDSEAERIVARMQQQVGDLLLEVINTKLRP